MLSLGAPRVSHWPVTLTADWPLPLPDPDSRSWAASSKRITSDADLTRSGPCHQCQSLKPRAAVNAQVKIVCRFLRSAAAKSFVGFVLSINEAVRDQAISADISCSPAVSAVLDGLASLSELVDDTPPVQHALRYGNPAYR